MRLLLLLTALMLAIAGGVWWKTTRSADGDPNGALQTDPGLGIATFGAAPATNSGAAPDHAPPVAAPASSGRGDLALPSEAVLRNPHEQATNGDPKEPPTAANEVKPPPAPVTPPAAAAPATADRAYTVKSGDTLYQIVKRAYGTAPQELVADVAKANGMKDPSALKVGQKLKLPSLAGYPAPKSN